MKMIRVPFAVRVPEFLRTFDELMEIYDVSNIKNEKDFSVDIPLPGLSKEDISINVSNRTLVIKVNLTEPTGYVKQFKDYVYEYKLTDLHDLQNVEANMKNGLLSIKVPLKEQKTEAIAIEVK